MIFIKESEFERMRDNIIDSETEMTELDMFEAAHCYEDWKIMKGE